MPRLIISERGRDAEWTHEISGNEISIGRHDGNTIVLPSTGTSRRHARIMMDGADFFLVDLDSGNGTYLNGMRLTPHDRYVLKNRDCISVDTFDLCFHTADAVVERAHDEEITESDVLEVKLLKKVLKAIDKETMPSLEVLNGTAEGAKFHLSDDMNELVIGRDPDVDVSINEHVISRRHARIVKRWGGIAIRDLESKNGTFVNNRRVVEEYLHDGDRIALGTIVLMFRNPQEINIAQLAGAIPPKHKPAPVQPDDIPGTTPEEPLQPEPEPEPVAAEEEFEQLEDQRAHARASYPAIHRPPSLLSRFSPIEIGIMGLGALVFIFALITLVNLMFA